MESDKKLFKMLTVTLIIGLFLFLWNRGNGVTPAVNTAEAPLMLDTSQSTQTTQSTSSAQNTPDAKDANSQTPASGVKQYAAAPAMQLTPGKKYKAVLRTSNGDIAINLLSDTTPITVNNFVFLAKEGFYEGVKFHRVINGFMIQTGDPLGNGSGGPGYSFADEKFEGEYVPGTVAMANAGPNTNGSQFFIMHGTQALPKNYVIFGKVADDKSMVVVNKIATTPVVTDAFGQNSKPAQDILINKVDISTE